MGKLTAERLAHIGFWVSVVAITAMGATLYDAMTKSGESSRLVSQTYEMLQATTSVEADFNRVDAAQRGYFITGNHLILAEREQALVDLNQSVARLKSLAVDSAQAISASQLAEMVAPRVALLNKLLQYYNQGGLAMLQSRIAPSAGGVARIEFFALVGKLQKEEQRLLAQREAAEREGATITRLMLITTLAVTLLILVPAYVGVIVQSRARERTHKELLSAKAAAEEASRAKSEFLSSMSHELRTPLNAILGFGQVLASNTLPTTDAQKKEFTGHILKAGWHLLTLINEVLDLAKIESGKLTLSLERVSLAEVLLECQTMVEPVAEKRGIQVTFPTLEKPLYVHADRTRLKQILLNLLTNAIKYNRQNGTVTVECGKVSERLRVSVTDIGMGLSSEELERLFQPFNRLGRETGAEEGTGIGLVVTKRLTELMGGAIGVKSTPGVGSVFWIDVDSSPGPEEADTSNILKPIAQTAATSTATSQSTILYIEDNPGNLKLVEQLIAFRADLRLLTASAGRLGIELARAHRPTIILMDINLPDINGIEALRILRSDPSTAYIPVLALSANAMPRDIENGLRAGFFGYLTKPIKVNEFMDTINKALEMAKNGNNPIA